MRFLNEAGVAVHTGGESHVQDHMPLGEGSRPSAGEPSPGNGTPVYGLRQPACGHAVGRFRIMSWCRAGASAVRPGLPVAPVCPGLSWTRLIDGQAATQVLDAVEGLDGAPRLVSVRHANEAEARGRPVSRSVGMLTLSTVPYMFKSPRISSSLEENEMLPT